MLTPLLILFGVMGLMRLMQSAEGGASLPARGKTPAESLVQAVEKGQYDTVTSLLRTGLSPNTLRELKYDKPKNQSDPRMRYRGMPLLYLAAQRGDEDMVNLLLAHGADLELPGRYGYTPLLIATQAGHVEVVRLLLEKGANLRHQEVLWQQSALHIAAARGSAESGVRSKSNGSTVRMSFGGGYAHGGVPGMRTMGGAVGFEHQLHGLKSSTDWDKNYQEICHLLVQEGADPTQKNKFGALPETVAELSGSPKLARLLKEARQKRTSSPKVASNS